MGCQEREHLAIFLDNIKIQTRNVDGLRNTTKRKKLFQLLDNSKFDIFLLQETHSSFDKENNWSNEWKGDIKFSHGSTNSRGVAILIRNNLNIETIKVSSDNAGRILIWELKIKGKLYAVVNIYGPNDDDPDFFNKVIQMTNDIESHTLIVAGDFNVALDPVMDRFGIHNRDTKPKSREVILTWMEDMNMVDIWRLKNPSLRKYTYMRNRPHPHGSRIDYFLISSSLINLVKDISLGAKLLSDHKPNNLTITVTENNRRMGYFKLNTAHLKNPEYVRQINEARKQNCTIRKQE